MKKSSIKKIMFIATYIRSETVRPQQKASGGNGSLAELELASWSRNVPLAWFREVFIQESVIWMEGSRREVVRQSESSEQRDLRELLTTSYRMVERSKTEVTGESVPRCRAELHFRCNNSVT